MVVRCFLILRTIKGIRFKMTTVIIDSRLRFSFLRSCARRRMRPPSSFQSFYDAFKHLKFFDLVRRSQKAEGIQPLCLLPAQLLSLELIFFLKQVGS